MDAVLSEELDTLPAKYRCALELCHLQGMTYDHAARQLNWPVATVKSRLTAGRLKLRQRLVRRGLAPGAVAATALTREARAAVPPELAQSTVGAATAGGAGAFHPAVTDLTEGVLKMMMWKKLKMIALGSLAAFGLTAEALSQRPANVEIRPARRPQTAVQAEEKPEQKTTGDRRWVRSLSSGAIIEVVGISEFPSGPESWWRPDGTPLRPRLAIRSERGSRARTLYGCTLRCGWHAFPTVPINDGRSPRPWERNSCLRDETAMQYPG